MEDTVSNNELSIKDYINILKGYIRLCNSKKKVIFIGSFLCALLGFGLVLWMTKKYVAHATITFTPGTVPPPGGLMQLAGDLGIMNASTPQMSEEKFIEMMKMPKIITGALLKKAIVNQRNDLLANHYLDIYKVREFSWISKLLDSERMVQLKDFRFYVPSNDHPSSVLENEMLEFLSGSIAKKLLGVKAIPKTGIINVDVSTINEEFSKYLCEYLIQSFNNFYIQSQVEFEGFTLEPIQQNVDSLNREMERAEAALAKWKDASNMTFKAKGYLEEARLQRSVDLLTGLYATARQNLETERYNLMINKCAVQYIDKPELPLERKELKWWQGIVGGFLIGCFLMVCYVIIGKWANETIR